MKNWAAVAAFIILAFFVSSSAFARGGGGCLISGTGVSTPAGNIAIEKLRVGDPVWSLSQGKLQKGTVQAITQVQPDDYLEIFAGEKKLIITAEHPVMVERGEFRIARLLQQGDKIYQMDKDGIHAVNISAIRHRKFNQPAYNLLVAPGGTFIPAGIIVHNKGCFLPESEILKADGTTIRISAVRRGNELLSYSPQGNIVRTKVREVIRHKVDEYILLKTDRNTLQVTAEHPFYTGRGTFKTLDVLKPGDTIFAWDGHSLSEQHIVSLQVVHKHVRVFNLQTDQPNTFFAAGLAVHNKGGGGGCFPAGTIIRTPAGQIPIEYLSANDVVQAVDSEGHITDARVDKLFATLSFVLSVKTNLGVLRTTAEHPVGLTDGTFIAAGKLRIGDKIFFRDNNFLIPATIFETETSKEKQLVYNLSVQKPHTFFAEDFVVHNKGGGGGFGHSGSGHSSSHGSASDNFDLFFNLIFLMIGGIICIIIITKKPGKEENLDYVYSRAQISKKSVKTEKLLNFISKQDETMAPQELRNLTQTTFVKLQECWQKRDYAPMKTSLMDDLFNQHTAQIQGLIRNNEINKIDNLKVQHIDIVNIRYTEKRDLREFTALITASARDYYVDDRTGKFLRGDNQPAQFQEFWTFQLTDNHWLLREIEQSGESDILKDENFVEMLTDQTIKGIYDDTAGKEGTAGHWLEKATEEKATRIDRILNFLVQTDKIWDRRLMLERARKIFLDVYLARENCDPVQLPADELFPDVAENLKKSLEKWRMEGTTVEYRNICVRKAELILIRNYPDPAKDEFTVRLSAHAQRVIRKAEQVLSEQQYVTPFEEYWTFGRRDNVWKLKEVLPPSRGEKMITEENVDEESSAQQVQWYSRQTRAN